MILVLPSPTGIPENKDFRDLLPGPESPSTQTSYRGYVGDYVGGY